MAITFHANGQIDGINNANFNSSLPSGHIIQTVTSLIGSSNTGGFGISSSDVNNPTFLDNDCKILVMIQYNIIIIFMQFFSLSYFL